MNDNNHSWGCLGVIILAVFLAAIIGSDPWQMFGIFISVCCVAVLILAIRSIVTDSKKKNKNNVSTEQEPADNSVHAVKECTSLTTLPNSSENKSETKETTPLVIKLSVHQFDGIKEAVERGIKFCKSLSEDDELRDTFYHMAVNSSSYQTYSAEDFLSTLEFFFANDLFDCFHYLGHDIDKIAKTEKPVTIDYTDAAGQALFATLSSLTDNSVDYKSFRDGILSLNQKTATPYDAQIRQVTENTLPVYLNSGASIKAEGVEDFNLVLLLRTLKKDELIPEIRKVYYDFANIVALSDNDKDETERAWLDDLKEKIVSKSIPQQQNSDEQSTPQSKAEDIANPMKQLNELIGLKQVKSELQTLTRFIEVNQKRREAGLRVASISYHCVFAGNPGTGKTTVARILAGIYKQLGILKKGQLIETDRSGLVAEYVGQTAVKTNKIIDKAIGGVLFIDEAYTLAQGGEQDFGREAIATLLKRMEDDRDRLVVILAGYTNEIEEFINTNPGLRSRFNRYVHFEDYTEEELFQIFLLQAKKYDYQLDGEAESALLALLKQKVANKQKDFGNARYVRNLFEKVIENQAVRLSGSKDLDKDSLAVITKEDIKE